MIEASARGLAPPHPATRAGARLLPRPDARTRYLPRPDTGQRLTPAWTEPARPPRPAPDSNPFRLDIEGLRAIAVLLVVCYHADLGPFPGGYIGVDVFFVVSGFLITNLLLGELRRTGYISFRRFWARRARRLLPASTLVLVSTVLVGSLVLDPLSVTNLAHDALAAAVFLINVVFAHRQSDYLTADAAPSPLLHYWSLALEEQFYLVWPVLLHLVAGYRRHPRALVTAVVVTLWPLSFWACMTLTRSNQPWAFYSLPTRAWELLTGAALSVTLVAFTRIPAAVRAIMGWAGLAAILVAAVTFDATTRFPGPAGLIPVLATATVIAAGPAALGGPFAMLRAPALTWTGKRSYSIYLWHWPVLVLGAAWFGPLSWYERLAAVLVAGVIAAVTFAVLENPVHHWSWLAAKARRGLILGGGLVAVSLATCTLVVASAPELVGAVSAAPPLVVTAPARSPSRPAPPASRAAPTPASHASTAPPTVAPTRAPAATTTTTAAPRPEQLAALNQPQLATALATKALPANLQPPVRNAHNDIPGVDHDGCNLDAAVTKPGNCTFGDPNSPTTIVLFGDSHAAQWFPALEQLATQHRWRLEVMTKKGCPTAAISVFSPMVDRELNECDAWRVNVAQRVAIERPTLMVMSSFRYRQQMGAWAGIDPNEAWRRGLTTTLDTFAPLAKKVLVLGDTPTPKSDVPSCVASHTKNVEACAAARSDAVRDDRLEIEREVAGGHGDAFVPTSDWLCTDTACPVIVGNVLVYRDSNHLTATAAAWLAPYLDAALTPLLAPPAPVVKPATPIAPAPAPTTPATTAAPPPPAPCAVSFVSDSVGLGILRNGLGDALGGNGCQLVWEKAQGGQPMDVGATALAGSNGAGSNVALVMLGFHNARTEVGSGRFPARIDAVMKAAGKRLVIWPLLASTRVCTTGYKQALAQADQSLREAQKRFPNLVVVDYPAFLAGHPEYANTDSCPHLLAAGYRATATWLAAEVRGAVDARAHR